MLWLTSSDMSSLLNLNKKTVFTDVRHAFVLEGPCRSWVCSTEQGEERAGFLSVLCEAMNSALKGHK